MRFLPTPIPQVHVVELERREDERGFFARMWCGKELSDQQLNGGCQQVSMAYNSRRGTLRGMHYQLPPHGEAKTVRVVRGAIHDVVIDLRLESPTFGKWFSVEITAENRLGIFIPEGCAHGYLTLCDETEVLYVLSGEHVPAAERGLHWNSPSLQGAWPFPPRVISERDKHLPFDLPCDPQLDRFKFNLRNTGS